MLFKKEDRSVKVIGHNNAPIVTGDNNTLTLTPPNTEQILDYNSFIETYNKSKFSTPLDIDFQFREKEQKRFEESIDSSQILLITGNAGVGKTKFALEMCNKFSTENGYIFKAVLGRGADLFNDIKTIFGQDERFIVLIDDANRVGMALEYILNYYGEKVHNGTIKIVLTVRDYAKDKVSENIPSQIISQEIAIKQLEDKEIRDIVKYNYETLKFTALERIASISKGNSRLAIMASTVAIETNSFASLYDVSNLYDKYFSTIQQDIDDFKDSELLLSISIISFFRVIDRENEQQMKIIEEAFSLSIADFWKNVDTLHDLEVVDLYENSVVKISDQILSMYLFYRAVFVDKKVNITVFLEHFFLLYQNRFIDMLNPLIDTFHFQTIFDVLKEPVDSLWKKYEIDENNLILIMKTFWFLKEEEILLFCSKKINALEKEKINIDSINLWTDINSSQSNKLLEILSLFKYSEHIPMAIEFAIIYLQKRPSVFREILTLFTKQFSYSYDSYRNHYKREEILLDILWKFSKNGEDELISKLFIRSSSYFLKFEFEENQYRDRKTLTIQRYGLLEIDIIKRQRDTIFENIFSLFSNEIYQKDILELLNKYPDMLGYNGISKIEEWDKIIILNFIDNSLDNYLYEHCLVVEKILRNYDRCHLEYDIEIKNKFKHHSCDIKNILMLDDVKISLENKKDDEVTDWDEIDRIKKERLTNFIDGYSIDDWKKLFNESMTIKRDAIDREDYKLKDNLEALFNILVAKDVSLYLAVITYYLELGNPLFLTLNIRPLIDILGKYDAYTILNKYEYNDKNQYLFRFFITLKNNEISMNDVEKLISLYEESEIKDMIHPLDYIEKYLDIQDSLLIDIVSIVLYKSKSDDKYITHLLSGLFDYTNISKNTEIYFEDNIELLKEVYLVTNKQQQHFDYTKVGLNKILNMDKSFLKDYLDSYFEKEKYISIHNIQGDYGLLWKRDDYEDIFLNLIDMMFEIKEAQKLYNSGEAIKAFFAKEARDRVSIDTKSSEVLKKYITLNSDNEEKIVFVFELIAEFSYETISEMVEHFLNENNLVETFKRLPFTPLHQSWSGSRIPSLQKEIDFYKTIVDLMDGMKFLEHKVYIKEHIGFIEKEIRGEMKRDFMDD